MSRWIREPFFHFALLGLGVFSFDTWVGSNSGETQIQVRKSTLNVFAQDRLGRSYESLNAAGQKAILNDYRTDEALFREARKLGIAETDDAIRIRMIEQMTQFAEQRTEIIAPNEAEINRYFEGNKADFEQPSSVSFRHLFFSGDGAAERAREVLGQLRQSPAGVPVADRFLFQSQYANRSREIIEDHFGERFADALEITAQDLGVWSGPIASRHGQHLVLVKAYTPARSPSVEEVYSEIAGEILRGKRLDQRAAAIEDVTSKYEIEIVD